ncbi:MAG: hypothetical protein GXO26_06435, partial [Crenarchaeota archaeon]|nr:hypothetical protein [Thermoproteota archaeon]
RAIEPIVAAILLIAIAIVAGALLYLWVSKLTASSQTSAPVSSQVQVLSTYYNGSVVVYVKTPGTLTANDIELMMLYFANNGTVYKTLSNCKVQNINDNVYVIACTPSSSLAAGVYYARIITKNMGVIVTPSFSIS